MATRSNNDISVEAISSGVRVHRGRRWVSVGILGLASSALWACTAPAPAVQTRTVACPKATLAAAPMPAGHVVDTVNDVSFGSLRATCAVTKDGRPLSSAQLSALEAGGVDVITSYVERYYSPARGGLDCAGQMLSTEPKWCPESVELVNLTFGTVSASRVALNAEFPANCSFTTSESRLVSGTWVRTPGPLAMC